MRAIQLHPVPDRLAGQDNADAAALAPPRAETDLPRAPAAERLTHFLRPGALTLPSLPPLSLYLHLPWCLRKCPYCDFNSHAVRAEPIPEQRYIDALILDLEASLPLIWGRRVHTIFIGGGTPSLFAPESIERLLGALRARVALEPGCEISLEANPGTFERDRFRAFAEAGVTRLSIGVQSFADAKLAALGRIHDAAQAVAAVEEARSSFATFNIDLMLALPGQSLDECAADVGTALALQPPHLSLYHLTVEPNTVFARYPPPLPDADLGAEMLEQAVRQATAAGLERYEISAFARPGQRARHNLNYWEFGDYLGLGAGAHGKLSFAHRLVRQVRRRDPLGYMAAAERGDAVASEHEVTRAELPFEFMLNALRLRDGFALASFSERTGLPPSAIEAGLAAAERRGLVSRDLRWVQPTERGFDFLSDLQQLFLPPA